MIALLACYAWFRLEKTTSVPCTAVVVCVCKAMHIAEKSPAQAKRHISSVSSMKFCCIRYILSIQWGRFKRYMHVIDFLRCIIFNNVEDCITTICELSLSLEMVFIEYICLCLTSFAIILHWHCRVCCTGSQILQVFVWKVLMLTCHSDHLPNLSGIIVILSALA